MAYILHIYLLYLCIWSIISSSDVDVGVGIGVGIQPKINKNTENSHADPVFASREGIKNEDEQKPEESMPVINISGDKTTNNKNKNHSSVNATTPKISVSSSNIKTKTSAEIESGAVMRGIYVFVGITLLFIMYIAFKTYRRRNKKNAVVKKYGVRTRRSDIEMEPLPLEEDEEDETIFDLGNVNNR